MKEVIHFLITPVQYRLLSPLLNVDLANANRSTQDLSLFFNFMLLPSMLKSRLKLDYFDNQDVLILVALVVFGISI